MKKRLFTLSIALTAMCVSTMAQVEINETNFPDENFRTFVSQNTIDTNVDGVLSQAELNAVTGEFYPIYQGIEDMTGIQYFTSLVEIACYGNNISGANMYKFVNCLPTVSNGVLVIAQDDADPDNVITKAQVKIAKDKGWEIIKFSGSLQSYAGEDLSVSATFFPDATFRSVVAGYDTDHNSILSEDELEKVLTIDVKNKGIKNLKGIEHFPNLVGLLCSGNNLTTLDVSNNKKLMILDCSNNSNMTSLTVSKDCEVLNEVAVYGTYIRGAEMTKVVENLPETTVGHFFLSSGFNNLITFDARVEADRKGWKVLFYDGENFKYAGYGITERNFPDENFRAFVAQYDTDKDDFLYGTELDLVTAMDVSEQGIKDLTGIECFSSMWSLNCEKNQLTALDLTMNQKLTFLSCWGNNISGTNMTNLIESLATVATGDGELYVRENPSSTADNVITPAQVKAAIDKGWMVKNIDGGELLVEINSTNFPDDNFRTVVNGIDSDNDGYLSEDERQGVKMLMLSDKNIKSLVGISYFSEVGILKVDNNDLSFLDLSGNPKLTILNCSGNSNMTKLTISTKCEELVNVSIENTKVTGSALDNLISRLPQKVGTLYVSESNAITDAQLQAAGGKGWSTKILEGAFYVPLGLSINESTFPDEKFRAFLLAQSYGSDAYFTRAELENVERLDVRELGIESLKGIEYFTNMYSLYCEKNLLTTLNVSENKKLTYLSCWGNSIDGERMDALLKSLPNVTASVFECEFIVGDDSSTPDNYITTAQAKVAADKGWVVKKFINGTLVDNYAGFDPVPINEDIFPDENFRKFVAAKPINANEDGFLSEEELKAVKIMNVSSKEISSLKGIEFFTALTKLNCSINSLTSLDVSKNTALTYLDCIRNNLESLDVSKNTALTVLFCSYNSLKSLDVSKNTALTYLDCYENDLKSLDVSKNTALKELDCSYNSLKSLEFSKNTALTSLSCYENGMESLDVSNCLLLDELYCNNNSLKSLDVSKNTALTKVVCSSNQISGTAMTNLVNSLRSIPSETSGDFYVCDDVAETDNIITPAQVSIATGKNWYVRKWMKNDIYAAYYAGLGDVNGDEKIDQDDLDTIVKIIMGQADLGFAGDLNNDGKTDAADIVVMVNILKSLGK